jgi:hypothetical protein
MVPCGQCWRLEGLSLRNSAIPYVEVAKPRQPGDATRYLVCTYHDINVDNRFRRQTWNRCTANVLDGNGDVVHDTPDRIAKPCEYPGPAWIVINDENCGHQAVMKVVASNALPLSGEPAARAIR